MTTTEPTPKYRAHILVVRLSALGDVAILQPILKARAEANPDVLFTMAAPPLLEPLFRGVDNLRFMPCQKRQSVKKLYRQLSAIKPTIVADMHYVNRVIGADLLFRLHGVAVRHIEKDRRARRRLVRQWRKDLSPLKPSWQRYDEVLDACGLRPAILPKEYCQVRHSADGHRRRIGIAPFAQHPGKIWPHENTRRLIALLAENEQHEILLFGGRDEAETLKQWADGYPNVSSTAGMHTFAEELDIIKSLDMMVSMDSANLHFASCLGIPTVTIWGATHIAGGFGGWRQDPQWSLGADMPCRPCSMYGKKPCRFGDYRCLSAIKPEQTHATIMKMLQESQANHSG